jgi:hypothetical protein
MNLFFNSVILDINNPSQHQQHAQAYQNTVRNYSGPGYMHGMNINSENFNKSYENSTLESSNYSSNFINDSRGPYLVNQYNQLNQISHSSQLPLLKASSKNQLNFSSLKDENDVQLNLDKIKIESKIAKVPNYKNYNNTNSTLNSVQNNNSSLIDTHSQILHNSQDFNTLDKGNILNKTHLNQNPINQSMEKSYINNRNPLLNLNENERTNFFPREPVIGQYGLPKSSLFSDDPFNASLFPNLKKSSSSLQNNLGINGQNVPITYEAESINASKMNSNQKFFNSSHDGSLYSVFKNIQKDSIFDLNKNTYSYFYFKLFDNYGEDLNRINSFDYKNSSKQELFKDDEQEKKKYEILNQIDDDGQDSDSDGKPIEDCFGPQKAKPLIKERNFKPY